MKRCSKTSFFSTTSQATCKPSKPLKGTSRVSNSHKTCHRSWDCQKTYEYNNVKTTNLCNINNCLSISFTNIHTCYIRPVLYIYICIYIHSPHQRKRCHRSQTQADSGWLLEPSREMFPLGTCVLCGSKTLKLRSHKSVKTEFGLNLLEVAKCYTVKT